MKAESLFRESLILNGGSSDDMSNGRGIISVSRPRCDDDPRVRYDVGAAIVGFNRQLVDYGLDAGAYE